MPTPLLMPALSPTMTEGTIARWLKKEGDPVKAGDVVAEIETDKATMEVEAVDEGTLGKILVPEGTANVKVNEQIAIILAEGESADAAAKPAAPAPKPAAAPAPAAPAPAAPAAQANGHSAPTGDRVIASPLARRMAEQAKVDLKGVSGSGPHGRIVRADIEAALQSKPGTAPAAAATAPAAAPAAKPAAPSAPAPASAEYELVPHTSMRKVIARRLTEAKQTIPHFYLTLDITLDALMKMRAELNSKNGIKLSVNDFVIRASALALRKMPTCNAQWSDEGVRLFKAVDVSVAVATPGGLITPIIRNADQKGLATISAEMKDLAARARENKLKLEEFQGGTFSISNLGMFGIRDFAAVINPPQGAILAVGAGEQRPVVKDGALAIATVMSVTLSVDHRVIDGALGAEYLGVLKGLLEDPLTMML